MKTQTRGVVRWLGIALAIAGIVGLTGFGLYRHALEERVRAKKDELALLMTLRRSALRQYWDTVQAEVIFWSLAPVVQSSLADLRRGWDALGDDAGEQLQRLYLHENPHPPGGRRELASAGDDSAYSEAHAALHPVARRFVEYRGYYDFFLISPDGDVLYTVEKEDDFATSLVDGAWRDTGLAESFVRARDPAAEGTVVFTDLARYRPSADEPAMFSATAIRADDGELLGVLAVQLPIERLREIMQFTAGMGESGETYLVGPDLLMRSDSRFSKQPTTLETRVDTTTARLALEGQQGFQITDDYRGIPVYSAYGPNDFQGVRWAVLAEIDVAEAHAPIDALRRLWLLTGVVGGPLVWALTVLLVLRSDEVRS